MRIVIDLQGAQTESRFRGIGRYSLSLAQAIARQSGVHEIWIAMNAQLPESIPTLRHAFKGLIPENRLKIFDVPRCDNARPWLNRAAEQIRECFLTTLRPDVILVASVFEGHWANAVTSIRAIPGDVRTVAVLYDLIPLLSPQQYLPTEELREYYHRKVGWLKNADMLLAISEATRVEGIKHLGLESTKVVNISTAVGEQFRPQALSEADAKLLLTKHGVSRKMVLYAPGGFDPRKNFGRLIEAYSRLPPPVRAAHQLVIVSRLLEPQRHELTGLRDTCGLREDELVLPGYVQDKDLICLYSLAELFVFPSVHEGFGLPLLEAMACGAPVIGSSTTSIPEVIGHDDALFDPLSTSSISEKMMQALTNTSFREQLRMHGPRHAKNFSWDRCAERALNALEKLDKADKNMGVWPSRQAALASLSRSLAMISHVYEPSDLDLRAAARSMAFNAGGSGEQQLLLDVSTIVHSDAKSGIQRVVRSLLLELLVSPPVGVLVRPIYFDAGVYRYANRFAQSIKPSAMFEGDDAPADFYQDDVYLSLDLNMHLVAQTHDTHIVLAARGIKLYFIVYDILLVKRPDWWTGNNAKLFHAWLTSIGENATGLVCISQAVADEVAAWFLLNKPKRVEDGPVVKSFHLGADVENSLPSLGMPDSAAAFFEELKKRPSFLMVGTIEPRKGHAQTLEAFEALWAKNIDINLVIVGKSGWLVDDLLRKLKRHPEKEQRLLWLEGISDEFLGKVYQCCTCLIAASEGEGFGLPLIEAAQHKMPLIARDLPVFHEVAGEHAFYFSGFTAEPLADAIQQWLALFQLSKHPRSDALPWLTWRESAQQLLAAVLPRTRDLQEREVLE